jgi:hypothetical protein
MQNEDNLTAESAAVRLIAAWLNTPPSNILKAFDGGIHRLHNVQSEFEGLCQARTAAAVKAARVEALEGAANECLKVGNRIGSVQGRASTRLCCKDIQSLITAAESQGGKDVG